MSNNNSAQQQDVVATAQRSPAHAPADNSAIMAALAEMRTEQGAQGAAMLSAFAEAKKSFNPVRALVDPVGAKAEVLGKKPEDLSYGEWASAQGDRAITVRHLAVAGGVVAAVAGYEYLVQDSEKMPSLGIFFPQSSGDETLSEAAAKPPLPSKK